MRYENLFLREPRSVPFYPRANFSRNEQLPPSRATNSEVLFQTSFEISSLPPIQKHFPTKRPKDPHNIKGELHDSVLPKLWQPHQLRMAGGREELGRLPID